MLPFVCGPNVYRTYIECAVDRIFNRLTGIFLPKFDNLTLVWKCETLPATEMTEVVLLELRSLEYEATVGSVYSIAAVLDSSRQAASLPEGIL